MPNSLKNKSKNVAAERFSSQARSVHEMILARYGEISEQKFPDHFARLLKKLEAAFERQNKK